MLLLITTTHRPATDLGYLLAKHPDRLQSFPLSFGAAHVVYPEASVERCTAALILDLDLVALVRGRPGAPGGDGAAGPLAQYVNDRPYEPLHPACFARSASRQLARLLRCRARGRRRTRRRSSR